jgi:adenylosuccinate lyase
MQRKYETEIAHIWSPEKKMELWTEIELLNLECWDPVVGAEARMKLYPPAYIPVQWVGMEQQVRLKEQEIGHEVEAFVQYLNSFYRTGLWHKGLASSDLVECWIADCVKKSEWLIEGMVNRLYTYTWIKAKELCEDVTDGFTHGQRAEPTTWGMRYRMWGESFAECPLTQGPSLAKISGAIGTGVVTHPDLPGKVHVKLNLDMALISSQIVPRAALASHLVAIYQIVMGAEKVANDLRMLYTFRQIDMSLMPLGSSSMPHKVNPHELEQVIGMCKMVMSMVDCVNRTNADNWLERDLVHSSVEREFLPMIFNHTYYALSKLLTIIERVTPSHQSTWPTDEQYRVYSSIALAKTLQHDSDRKEARNKSMDVAMTNWLEYREEVRRAAKDLIIGPEKATDA